MGNCFAAIGASIGFCFCGACGSLISSCFGNDKASTIPPGATSGRKRSVLLLLLSIGIALGFQYGVAPLFQSDGKGNSVQYLVDAWTSGCDDLDFDTSILQEICSGNSGVYRAAGSALVFFICFAIAAALKPTANREAWPAKYVLFIFLAGATIFIPNDPLFNPVMMNIFRAGAVLFVILEQLICVDIAYNLNESWVEKANKAEMEEGEGAGNKWLNSLLAGSAILFSSALVAIGFMYKYFSGCDSNMAFISVTLIMGVICTAVQLTGEEASLFTSASIFGYTTYLCYTAVSRNPNGDCNPRLGDSDTLGIILGIGLTVLSLLWTGWSNTAHKAVGEESDAIADESRKSKKNGDNVAGVVIDDSGKNDYGSIQDDEAEIETATFSNSWKLNIIFCLITCWFAMALTSWGSIENGGNSANPTVGNVSMWMISSSQWLVFVLYLWTLLAPKLFSDRDFS